MGCGASTSAPSNKYEAPPETKADAEKTLEAAKDVNSSVGFPMHVMRMRDFLSLTELRPHNDLVKEGLVVPIHDAKANGEIINFVSHQWLGYKVADPENAHLHTMQAVFNAVIEGNPEDCFRDKDQWEQYSKGLSMNNRISNKAGSADVAQLSAEDEACGKSAEDFRLSVAPETSWVWMDFISIPQTITCVSKEEVQQALTSQAAAINSIPSYVSEVENFFICAPQNAMHVDMCQPCNYETWYARGWCRLEETILMLTRAGDGRPLFVTQPVGMPPKLFTNDSIDRLWMHTARHSSVLTGTLWPLSSPSFLTARDLRHECRPLIRPHRSLLVLPPEARGAHARWRYHAHTVRQGQAALCPREGH